MSISALTLLVPALVAAQAPAPPQPHINFDSLHFDFGKIPGDAKVVHRFKVTNTGKATLNITRLNPSCGCTSTVLGKWSLAPEESTEVEVTFNPAGFGGLSRKSVQVVSDDPANPMVTLTFQADVVREVNPSTETVFFQDVVRTVPRKASVRLSSGNNRPVRVTDTRAPGASWLSAKTRPEGNDAWVDITLDGRKIPTSKMVGADPVIIRTTSSKVPSVTIMVQWEMRPSVTADPVRVAWAEAAGQELTAKVVLRQTDNKPFRILSARATGIHLKLSDLPKDAAPRQEFQVILPADTPAGLYTEKINLTLDDPDQPQLELRVSAALR